VKWFPVSKAKIPLIRGWSDPANCNDSDIIPLPDTGQYGLLTGYDWVILDLDVRAASGDKPAKDGVAVLREFLHAKGLEWPKTWSVRTPSGGLHLYFEVDPARPLHKHCPILPGVDFLALGAYARAGEGYHTTQEYGEHDPLPVPDWLYDLVAVKEEAVRARASVDTAATPLAMDDPKRPERIGRATQYLLETDPCVSGQGGDERLWEVCLRLTRSYELDDTICMTLLDAFFNPRCQPPWAFDVLLRKLQEAREKGTCPIGTCSAAGFLKVPPAAPVAANDSGTPHEYSFIPAQNACNGEQVTLKATDVNGIFAGQSAQGGFEGVWCYDEMSRVIVARDPPMPLEAERGGVSNADAIFLQHWLGSVGYKVAIPTIFNAIEFAAKSNRVHPIREYLAALPAPTTNHLRTIGSDLFGDESAEASDYIRRWMIGCVARVMKPGCQFDTALTLVGAAGGERKSTFFEVLAGRDYYRSSLAKIDNQQAVGMNLRGMWIVELGELSAMKANEKEAFKEFITRRKEQFNAKYERAEAREDRQCGIAATTNTIEFLDRWDQAIRRRFWPVTAAKRIDISWVREHRDELWSEAYAAYMAGEMWWYDDEAALDETKEKYIAATPTEEKLLEYLGDPSKLPTVNGQNATTITQMVLGLQGAVPLGVRQQVALLLAKYGKEYGLERQRKRGLTTYRVIEKVTGA
jgi:hypothetical protein